MEPARLTTTEPPKKDVKNPARVWLFVSIVGFAISLIALGFHYSGAGSLPPQPLPPKILRQVFGFTPYYFEKNTPPNHLHLVTATPKFLGNALSFNVADSNNQVITISEKAKPGDYKRATKSTDTSFESSAGTATIEAVQGGHITAILITKDNTQVSIDSSDILNSDILKDIISKLIPIDKNTGLQTSPNI